MNLPTSTAIIVAWWGFFGIATSHAQEPLTPLVVVDGKPVCGEWLEMLKANPDETVVFTGNDRFGQKIKVLVDGQKWRLVILAGAVEPKYGCEFLAGDGLLLP